ncbi:MAG: lytic murein transglycosylase [Epsilonproteobacteria bacterium]|nr:lytic murein transglycosylase [Campylobacterota bacterium]
MRSITRSILVIVLFSISLHAIDFTQKKEVKSFINMMHKQFNYNKPYLYKLFKSVRKDSKAPTKTTKTGSRVLSNKYRPQGSWEIYSRMHLENNQTNLGVAFMYKHREIFDKAYQTYGVSPEYIAAIIGIESYYGKNRGRYYVFDTLSHLAFGKNRRKKFYQYELQEFLRMCYREQVEPRAVKGSKSGAIGLAQFMPSNYKSLAVDFNNDGKIRISTPVDAIGSVANYLKEHGWDNTQPVTTRVSYEGNRFYGLKTGFKHRYQRKYLPNIYPKERFDYYDEVMLIKLEREKYDELWYGAHNFYVITRYNHSAYYAMAVHQLAQKIKTSYMAKYQTKAPDNIYVLNK